MQVLLEAGGFSGGLEKRSKRLTIPIFQGAEYMVKTRYPKNDAEQLERWREASRRYQERKKAEMATADSLNNLFNPPPPLTDEEAETEYKRLTIAHWFNLDVPPLPLQSRSEMLRQCKRAVDEFFDLLPSMSYMILKANPNDKEHERMIDVLLKMTLSPWLVFGAKVPKEASLTPP